MIGIKIPWQVFACAGVVLVLSVAGWFLYDLGRDHKQAEWDAAIERGRRVVEDLKARQGNITISGEIRYVETVKVIKEKGSVVERKIPVYIPVDTVDLPAGFRVLHDAAATNTIPGASEATVSVPVREATATISRNYQVCMTWKAALDEQVQWAAEQRKLYLEKCKQLKLSCN